MNFILLKIGFVDKFEEKIFIGNYKFLSTNGNEPVFSCIKIEKAYFPFYNLKEKEK